MVLGHVQIRRRRRRKKKMAEKYMRTSAAAKGLRMAAVAASFIRSGWHPHIGGVKRKLHSVPFLCAASFCSSLLLFLVKVKHEGAQRLPRLLRSCQAASNATVPHEPQKGLKKNKKNANNLDRHMKTNLSGPKSPRRRVRVV